MSSDSTHVFNVATCFNRRESVAFGGCVNLHRRVLRSAVSYHHLVSRPATDHLSALLSGRSSLYSGCVIGVSHLRRQVRSTSLVRSSWLAVSRVIVMPTSLEVVRVRASSAWSSRRDVLFGWGDLSSAYLWRVSVLLRLPTAYVRFLTREMTKADMFSHRQLIRSVLALATLSSTSVDSGLVGISFYVSGKISVGGNSRSRHMVYFGGLRAPSRLFVEARTARGVVSTVTGCLGVLLTMFF